MSCLYRLLLQIALIQGLPFLCQSLSPRQKEEILTFHNTYRQNIARGQHGPRISNMNKLEWSDSLEASAASAVSCSRRRVFNDDSMLMPMFNFGKYRRLNISKILVFWTRESRYFVPEESECIPWDSCNRYRAMLGADRERIGCALKSCPRRNTMSYVLLCLYDGGDPDSFRYKTGTVCTRCTDNSPFCQNGLCVACSHTENRTCACAKTCQRENVGSGYLNSTTCSCTCLYGLGPNCDEECRNPELYADYDFCATVTRDDCNEPDVYMSELMRESCPEQCACRKHPNQAS